MTTHAQIHRIAVSFPIRNADALDAEASISVFHRWIREGCELSGLLIDVADYRHVPDGPGVMLIGLEWDRSIEFTTGGPAVRSVNKLPPADDAPGHLRAVAADALTLAGLLARPDALGDAAGIDVSRCRVTVLDRLAAANDDDGSAAFAPVVEEALAPLRPGRILRDAADPRGPLTVEVALDTGDDPGTLAGLLRPAARAA